MERSINQYLGTVLKNWVAQHQSPAHGRARLLWLAAHSPRRDAPKKGPRLDSNTYRPTDWSHILLSWDIVHSFQGGMTGSRLVV